VEASAVDVELSAPLLTQLLEVDGAVEQARSHAPPSATILWVTLQAYHIDRSEERNFHFGR
jgi:hypothetical protein